MKKAKLRQESGVEFSSVLSQGNPSLLSAASTYSISQGAGQPVVLLHGMASSSGDWVLLIPRLVQSGYHALAPDLLGHGASAKPENPQAYTMGALLAVFESWLDVQGLEHRPWLVGHSMGGYLAMRYALKYPHKVRGLVLIDPLYDRHQLYPLVRAANRRPALGKKALHWLPPWLIQIVVGWDPTGGKYFSPDLRSRIANDFKRASPHIMHLPASMPDLTPRLSELDLPSLVIWGVHDLTLQPKSFPRLVSMLPQAVGNPIHHSGHEPHLRKPDLVNRLILEYIASS